MSSETDICFSCLRKVHIYNIFDTHECEGNDEIYAEMLKTCFDISISRKSNAKNMCEECILKLRDAYYFKQKLFKNIKQLESLRIQIELLSDSEHPEFINENDEDIDPNDMYVVVVKPDLENTNDLYKNEERTGLFEKIEPFTVNKLQNTYNRRKKDSKQNYLVIKEEERDEAKKEVIVITEKVRDTQERMQTPHKTASSKPQQTSKTPSKCDPTSDQDAKVSSPQTTNFTCEYCGKHFATKISIRTHMSTHQTGQFPCHICNKVFSKTNTRSCHIWRVHRTRAAYSCSECGERFPTLHRRLRHLRSAHQMQPALRCPYCDRTYFDASTRSKHIRGTHLKVRNHKCSECKMAFFKRRMLLSHQATMHGMGEMKYACYICDKKFYLQSTLKTHLKRHEKYNCNICRSSFGYDSYKAHSKLHENESQSAMDWTMDQSVVVAEEQDGSNDTVYFDVSDLS